jgi:predicted N-formylglutamate amidohydrolase
VTILAKSAFTEQQFSALICVHTYTRTSQGQQRPAQLSIISIKKKMLKYLKSESVFMTALLANVPRKAMNRAEFDDKIRF